MPVRKVIIIGAGIAGLASAVRLALQGFQVSVFEKNAAAGGKLATVRCGDFIFDYGPSLFTEPSNIEELFTLAEEDIKQYFTYESLPVSCRYFYEDGMVINAFTNPEDFSNQLTSLLNENNEAVKKYLSQSEKLYNTVAHFFLNNSLHRKNTWLKVPFIKAFTAIRLSHLFNTLHQLNAKSFSHPNTIQLFNRYATYNGSNPYKTPALFSLIPHLEMNIGTYYPHGGMQSIADAVYRLALKKGVQFYFNTLVQQINHCKQKVTGVLANNKNYYSDVVVSNMDIYFTYKNLLHNSAFAQNLLQTQRSSSAIIFYWGIRKEFDSLQLHNIFFSKNYKAEFDCLDKGILYNDPTVYVNITAKCEKEKFAPAGKENWFVMINAPAGNEQNRDAIKAIARKNIIDKLNRILHTNMELFIESEEISDPVSIEEQSLCYRGALYGSASNTRLAAFLRHPNFSGEISGLYFVGGTVHPGGGIPLCFKSAKIACRLIEYDFKKETHNLF